MAEMVRESVKQLRVSSPPRGNREISTRQKLRGQTDQPSAFSAPLQSGAPTAKNWNRSSAKSSSYPRNGVRYLSWERLRL
jgi:hypothetical protein